MKHLLLAVETRHRVAGPVHALEVRRSVGIGQITDLVLLLLNVVVVGAAARADGARALPGALMEMR